MRYRPAAVAFTFVHRKSAWPKDRTWGRARARAIPEVSGSEYIKIFRLGRQRAVRFFRGDLQRLGIW